MFVEDKYWITGYYVKKSKYICPAGPHEMRGGSFLANAIIEEYKNTKNTLQL